MQVKIRHPQHFSVMTYVNGKQVELHNHEGYTDMKTALKLVESPFGYEFAGSAMPFNKDTWTKEKRSIMWNHIMPYYEGYGYVAQMTILGLIQNHVDVSLMFNSDYSYTKQEIMEVFDKPKRFDTWSIWHHFWMKPNMLPTERKAIYTMWESTELQKDWIPHLNSVNIVFVPSEQNVQSFKANGVTVPIKVIEHGVDQEFYFYRPKKKKDYFTFGTMGSLVARKNPELLIKAFKDEFDGVDDVKLLLKDTYDAHPYRELIGDDSRITLNTNKVTPYEIGNILAEMDVAIFPSRGEGFGLGGLQAMGVGTTCICTDWGGFKQYLNPEYNFALKCKLTDIKDFPSNNTLYNGQWAEADYDHLRELMRYAYEHQDEMHEKGKKASQWVKEYWTWERCAKQLIDAIDEYEGIK